MAALRNEPEGGFESSMISIPKAFARMFEPACAKLARSCGIFERPIPALCKSTIASTSENKYFQVWAATRRVVEPFMSPGKLRFKSRPSGKYLDFERYPGKFTIGTIRIVPANCIGSRGFPASVNVFERRCVHVEGPVNSSPCTPPRIVMVGPGRMP